MTREIEKLQPSLLKIRDMDMDAARWWAAIMAPDQGWKTVGSQRDDGACLSPWSVSVECGQRIGMKWRTTLSFLRGRIELIELIDGLITPLIDD
jgi:hypothetical protein